MRVNLIIFLLLLAFSTTTQAEQYFVAPNGSDAAPGTESQPWKTIQKSAEELIAGDIVYVKAGTYKERVTVQNSGTENNYIIFTNYQDDVVTIDGDGITWWAWGGLFDVTGKNYIEISGFNIMNSTYAGIFAENSGHIIIKNNSTYNTLSSGIGVWSCSDVKVENNEVELACNDGVQECISIAGSSNCEIWKNHVHHNGPGTDGGEGIDVKQGSHDIKVYRNLVHDLNTRIGIYVDAWKIRTYNIDIFQNVVHHCTNSGITIQTERGGPLENVNIFNNISYCNKWDGIVLGSVTSGNYQGPTPVKRVKIINNTCYKNGAIDAGWGFGILINNPDAENVVIRNNICSENSAQISIQQIKSGDDVSYNLIYGNNSASGTVYGSNYISGDPLFSDSSSFDFHLTKNSPAIDHGSLVAAPDDDFDGNRRCYGENIDIGAYEYFQIPKLLFSSGFEGGVTLPDPVEDYQYIQGTDSETGYAWPINILGASGSGLHLIDDDNNRAIENEIQTVTGHNGNLTKALYSVEHYNIGVTQSPYEILEISDGRKDLYVKFWIKMDSDSLAQDDMWRTFFEWKTKDYAAGTGFRLIAFIYTDQFGNPYWHWQGDADPENPVWEIDNTTVPVPINEWFLTEFYWHWSEGEDGRALWKVNGRVIGDHYGPTTRNAKPIDFIMLTQIYGDANPKYQWVDDIEIWDSYHDDLLFYVSADGGCGEHLPGYSKINNACRDSGACQVIRVKAGFYPENISFAKPLKVFISGGWNQDYSDNGAGKSVVGGTLTIIQGTVVVDGITLGNSMP